MTTETEWIPVETKPKQKGVYKRKDKVSVEPFFQRWTGKYWGYMCYDLECCIRDKNPKKSLYQDGHWKGLVD